MLCVYICVTLALSVVTAVDVNGNNAAFSRPERFLTDDYKAAMTSEVNRFAVTHPKGTMSNHDFGSQLYNKLASMFHSRDWLVLVAAVTNSAHFMNHACDLNQHDNHGRSIVIASVDKSKPAFNKNSASHILHGVGLESSNGCVDSSKAFARLPDSARHHCNTYAAAGVLCTKGTDWTIRAAGSRYVQSSHSNGNMAYLFG